MLTVHPQYGPEIAPLTYRHLGGAVGAVGEWSMCFAVVFGGGIALMSVNYAIWFWQLGSCILACICKTCTHVFCVYMLTKLSLLVVWFWCPEVRQTYTTSSAYFH